MKKSTDTFSSPREKIRKTLREEILQLELEPGEPLSEQQIADRFEVSRTPVREALHQLIEENLVEKVPNKGAYVNYLSKEEVRQVYEMAESLESMAVYLITSQKDGVNCQGLRQAIKKMEQGIDQQDTDLWINGDEQYHREVTRLCPNGLISEELSNLHDHVHRIRLMTVQSEDREESTKDHKEICKAILNQESDEARDKTHEHWERIRSEVLNIIVD